MGITTVPSGPSKGKVNPIPARENVGVKEDGYRKQLAFNSKKIPVKRAGSAETNNPNGQSFGTKVG